MKLHRHIIFFLLLAVLAPMGCSEGESPAPEPLAEFSADLLNDWTAVHLQMSMNSPAWVPTISARALAYMSLVQYEALVPAMPGKSSLVGRLQGLDALPQPVEDQEYFFPLVANEAIYTLTPDIYYSAQAQEVQAMEATYASWNAELTAQVEADVADRSKLLGQQLAEAVFVYSQGDGGHRASAFPDYDPPMGDGMWQPEENLSMTPFWGSVRPFVAGSKDNTLSEPHMEFASEGSSDFYAAAKEVFDISEALTSEQVAIAEFWTDDPQVSFTPAGHSFSILSQVLAAEEASLALASEAYVYMGIAQHDTFISVWQTKYDFNLLRPSAFIQQYVPEGNLWLPTLLNPQFPEYVSGHSAQAAAAASVLELFFGEDYAFTDRTHDNTDLGLPARNLESFDAMAREVGISRVYGGIHYQFSNFEGYNQGKRVANYVINSLQ